MLPLGKHDDVKLRKQNYDHMLTTTEDIPDGGGLLAQSSAFRLIW